MDHTQQPKMVNNARLSPCHPAWSFSQAHMSVHRGVRSGLIHSEQPSFLCEVLAAIAFLEGSRYYSLGVVAEDEDDGQQIADTPETSCRMCWLLTSVAFYAHEKQQQAIPYTHMSTLADQTGRSNVSKRLF